jgi:phospholipid/cholesterol/gamma-HCH transport system substrate-binding protein
MIKQTPSIGRIVAMVVFTLSVFGLLMFLWLAFGGPIPLKPEGYRMEVHFPEAATLAVEADVRMAGVNVGKVKKKALDKRGARTNVEIEIQNKYAPIPKDTKAILRQKTLLGETYVELAQGHKPSGMLEDGGTLPNQQVEPTVELDEIFSAFDHDTRAAFQQWVRELAKAIHGGHNRSQDLNDAFGNLAGFSTDGAKLLSTLDDQETAVHRLIKNTGVVFGAINERQGALRQLIVNSGHTFEATASRDEALAETFRIFPTFLDESKATQARLERFSRNTHPLVNDLKGPADDLGPTVHDLGRLSPHLTKLFRDLEPLIRASRTGVPALQRVLKGVRPVLDAAHVFFPELNPILSYFNFRQVTIAGFLSNAGPDLAGFWGDKDRGQEQIGILGDPRNFQPFPTGEHPVWERGNSYYQPNALQRGIALGITESFNCNSVGGERRDPDDATGFGQDSEDKIPPCFTVPGSLYNGQKFVKPERGVAPKVDAPKGREGRTPAVDPNPNDPAK